MVLIIRQYDNNVQQALHADLETTELFGNVKLQQEPVLAIIMSLIIHVGGTVVYFWPVSKIISMPMFWVQTGWMPIWAFGNVDIYQQVKIWHYIEKDEYLGLVFSCQTQDVYFAWCIMGFVWHLNRLLIELWNYTYIKCTSTLILFIF